MFDYLTDPRNRAQWQSSLRRVDDVAELGDRPGDVGTSWTDVTVVPGVAPRLEVTACEPPRLWREIGTWRSVDAVLTLELDDRDGGTDVRAQAILTVAGCSSDSDSDSTAADTTAASGVESCPAEPTKADASPQWTLKGATGELEVVAATENEAPKITCLLYTSDAADE